MSSPQGVQRAWVDEIVLYLGDRFEVPVRKPIKIGRFIMPPTEVIGDHLDHILDDLVDETGAQELLDRPTPYMMWSATEFLGRDPTSSESAAISRALRRLGQRGLIRRRRRQGEKRRRLVRLTAAGKLRYVQLRLARWRET